MAEATASGTEATLEPEEAATGRYVLLWVVSLPAVSDGYRAELAEVVVRGQ